MTRICLLSLLIVLKIACTPSCKKEPQNSLADNGLAALVNGKSVPMAKLDQMNAAAKVRMELAGHKVDEDLNQRLRSSILKKMIDDEIMRQTAQKEGINVDRFERVEGLDRYKARLGGEQSYMAFIKQRNMTEEQVLEMVVDEIIRTKLVEKLKKKVEVHEDDIKRHYENNKNLYTLPPMVHARHILLKASDKDPKEKVELIKEKAHMILKEARQEKVSFSMLAQKYGEGPTAKQEGDLGFFPRGRMVKAFEDAAFDAPLKTAIGPIRTEYGFHLIYVEEKTPKRVASLHEVRDRIREFLAKTKESRQSETLLISLRKNSDIRIFDSSLTVAQYKGKDQAKVAIKE